MNTAIPTLADRVWPAASSNRLLRAALLAVLGSALVAVCAQVNVPMVPVPMTLQTLAVLAIGGAYGSRLGAATLALYALEGAIGLPVFAEFKAGPAILMGPTGGYIVGFIAAAGLVGFLAERGFDRHVVKMFAATLLGAVVLYIPGLANRNLRRRLRQGGGIWPDPLRRRDLVETALAALALTTARMWLRVASP
jgi:biotin transport system substrate-specific component